jgi:hypothetical protein
MDTQDKLDKKIGTKESVKLQAGSYVVKAVSVENVKKKTGEAVGEKVVLSIKHADSQDLVALSSATYLKNKSVKQSALWYQEDADGNIPKSSALAEVMRFYKIESIRQFEGKNITTEVDDKGYLCVKAY